MKDFLPIGSVVLLKETKKRLMIIGRVQICENTVYKYSGVLYPEGYIDSKNLYLFNESDIDKVYYLGMQDEEEFSFRKALIDNVEENVNKAQ